MNVMLRIVILKGGNNLYMSSRRWSNMILSRYITQSLVKRVLFFRYLSDNLSKKKNTKKLLHNITLVLVIKSTCNKIIRNLLLLYIYIQTVRIQDIETEIYRKRKCSITRLKKDHFSPVSVRYSRILRQNFNFTPVLGPGFGSIQTNSSRRDRTLANLAKLLARLSTDVISLHREKIVSNGGDLVKKVGRKVGSRIRLILELSLRLGGDRGDNGDYS